MTAAYSQSRQDKVGEKWTDRVFFGGGLGAGFANGWNINVSPQVGYKLSERLWSGVGFDYNFVSRNFNNGSRDRFTVLGPKVFAWYFISQEINAGSEYAYYDFTYKQIVNGRTTESNESQRSWLIGGGYTQAFGRGSRSGMRIELYYDVLFDDSPGNFNFRNSAFVPRVSFIYGL